MTGADVLLCAAVRTLDLRLDLLLDLRDTRRGRVSCTRAGGVRGLNGMLDAIGRMVSLRTAHNARVSVKFVTCGLGCLNAAGALETRGDLDQAP